MDLFELKKEQSRLAAKIVLKDGFSKIKLLGGADCAVMPDGKILACVVVCEFPSFKLIEKKTAVLNNPLPYNPDFVAYREMPAIIDAYNLLEQEPDILLVDGSGILHPRRLGLAAHVGLALNKPVIGVAAHLPLGRVEKGKIILETDIVGFEITTREHSNPVYVSPGHLVSLGTVLHLIPQTIHYPHKMPEPVHIAHKIAKKKAREGDLIITVLAENDNAVLEEG